MAGVTILGEGQGVEGNKPETHLVVLLRPAGAWQGADVIC